MPSPANTSANGSPAETPPARLAPPPLSEDVEAIMKALAAPFEPDEVKWKPQMVSGNRALAVAYVDARVIQDRLDDVLGVTGWQDDYECLSDGSVVCRLRLRIGDEWLTKVDVGSPSEQPDEGDRRKAAFSDSLKRAAVKFAIGRYLYRLSAQWVDYDPQRKQLVKPPKLPASALPVREQQPAKSAAPAPQPAQPAAKQPSPRKPAAKTSARGANHALPANGAELQRRLADYDARLATQGLCAAGALVKHVAEAGARAGYDADLSTWSGPAILLAVEETRAFEAQLRQQAAERKEVA